MKIFRCYTGLSSYQSHQPELQATLGWVNSLRWPQLPMAGLGWLQALSLSQHNNKHNPIYEGSTFDNNHFGPNCNYQADEVQ